MKSHHPRPSHIARNGGANQPQPQTGISAHATTSILQPIEKMLRKLLIRGLPAFLLLPALVAGFVKSSAVQRPISVAPLPNYLETLSSAEGVVVPSSSSPNESASAAQTSVQSNFQYVPVLSLSHADSIANKVITCCERNGFNPIAVYVLDASGSTLVSKRMDGCSPVGIPDFAHAKAYSCIVNKYPSRAFRDRYTADEASSKFCQMTAMVAISGNQMAPFPGGILLKLGDTVVGAVGVSGAAGDEDEYCAIRGVLEANLGLVTIPDVHVLTNTIDG